MKYLMLNNEKVDILYETNSGCSCIENPLIGGECKGHKIEITRTDYGENIGFKVFRDKELLFYANKDDLINLAKLIFDNYK